MSTYILDTDTLSLYRNGHGSVCQRVNFHIMDIAVSVISVEEQLSGWYTALRRAKRSDVLAHVYQELADNTAFLATLPILSFTESAILHYQQLLKAKLGVRKMDLRIAAITLENNAILVTRNIRDFQRVPNLIIEDWSV